MWIFIYLSNSKFCSSPDAIGPVRLSTEIKTGTLNSEGPLQYLEKFLSYFAQTQQEMACTEASFCILLSYHPETESGNFFLIQKDNVLEDVIMGVCNFIYNQIFDSWSHTEIKELQMFGEKQH